MLSLLPDLLDFSSIAPVILRLALGGTLLSYGFKELFAPQIGVPSWMKIVGIWESVLGVLLLAGLFTQVAALLAGLEFLGYLFLRLKDKAQMPISANFLLVMLAIALSLVLLGPGLFAIDLPL